jgi:hypothetical protein
MEPLDEEIEDWLENEVASCEFQDVRHGKRFRTLLSQLSGRIGGSIPFACQDWAATKAAYRFLSNTRVDEGKILAGHFLCTRDRFAATASASRYDRVFLPPRGSGCDRHPAKAGESLCKRR